MRNQTLKENMLWAYPREIRHKPRTGLCEADFVLITQNEHHILLLNQEAVSVKLPMPYIYPTLQLLLQGQFCPLKDKYLAGTIQVSAVAACLPYRGS